MLCSGVCLPLLDCPATTQGCCPLAHLPALYPTQAVYPLFSLCLGNQTPISLGVGLGGSTWPCLGLCTYRKPDVSLAYGGVNRKYILSRYMSQFLWNSVNLPGYLASIKYLDPVTASLLNQRKKNFWEEKE
jgi:hypothetical protein